MRLPVIKNVLNKTFTKTWHFLYEAVPMFAAGTILLGVLHVTNSLEKIEKALAPLVVNILNLPAETAEVFIMGLIRRDFAATGLADMAGVGSADPILTAVQSVVSIVVITLFVPCIAAILIMLKERGFIEAMALWLGSLLIAFATGGILSVLLNMVF